MPSLQERLRAVNSMLTPNGGPSVSRNSFLQCLNHTDKANFTFARIQWTLFHRWEHCTRYKWSYSFLRKLRSLLHLHHKQGTSTNVSTCKQTQTLEKAHLMHQQPLFCPSSILSWKDHYLRWKTEGEGRGGRSTILFEDLASASLKPLQTS